MSPLDHRWTIIATAARVRPPHAFMVWHAVKELGKAFDPVTFAAFAMLEEKHITAILSALEAHLAMPGGRTASVRGTRLQADFQLPDEWQTWAINERGWHPEDVMTEAANFTDYWLTKTGQAATKLDWKRVWQTWCRNAHRPQGNYRIHPERPQLSRGEWLIKQIGMYERLGRESETAHWKDELAALSNVVPFKAVG